ncbi:MAG: flagellin lysine-N-methylase [Lachnospiraceae bacterium]|nr:flagellin lysine-N-methylase [Lachnospiraceae bacterium]
MRYTRPHFYDDFVCTADKCPDTCCAGWQIMIDEDTLEKYKNVKGDFRKRLHSSIDWEEGCFFQFNERRCAFLNDRNLCDLYLALGEEGFCDTCRKYPRHTEEFEGIREYSLSLSCPVAARMILANQGMLQFAEIEDEEEDELEDEFEDFDLMLFTQLEDARKLLFEKLECLADKQQTASEETLQDVMGQAMLLAEQLQYCVEDGRYFEIEEWIEKYRSGEEIRSGQNSSREADSSQETDRYHLRSELFQNIENLERLREEWNNVLKDMYDILYSGTQNEYQKQQETFAAYLDSNPEKKAEYENICLQLFVFFVYTYFCGAVYDGWIYSKMALAVRSVEFLQEMFLMRWKQNGELTFEDYVELSYRYAREIEHSDQNLIALEECFMEEIVELE